MRRILHDPVEGTPRHVCRIFSAKNRKFDLSVFNIRQNLAKILDPTLRQCHLKQNNVSYSFLRTNFQMSTPFLRDNALNVCTRVLHAHPEA